MFTVVNSGKQTALENMSQDAALLQNLGDDPILHLYDWKTLSLTYGHFVCPEKHIHLEAAAQLGVSLAKRPTGGGIVFHIWDYAFSFLMPASHPFFSENRLENYQFVNAIVLEVIDDFLSLSSDIILDSFPIPGQDCEHFCMARPTQYDVVYKGMKIAGAAQRRTKKGYLHQGTISLCSPDKQFLMQLLQVEDVVNAMMAFTFAPIQISVLTSARVEIGLRLAKAFQKKLWRPFTNH